MLASAYESFDPNKREEVEKEMELSLRLVRYY
jgi:hypothetical protein